MMQSLKVGEPFPGPVPGSEGAHLALTPAGLTMLAQCPGLKQAEINAFQIGGRQVCLLETGSVAVPVCVVIVDWPRPLGPMDMAFDARRVPAQVVADWLDTAEGVKNALQVILLDGRVVRGLKLMGLNSALVEQMHAVIRRQLATVYSQADYDRELARVFQRSTTQLMARAECYQHRGGQ